MIPLSLNALITKLNQEMGGLHRLLYTLDSGKENGIYEPIYLQRLEAFAQWFRTQEGVSSVYTYTDVMKRLIVPCTIMTLRHILYLIMLRVSCTICFST
jgi:hypothetical protein